MNMDQWWNDNDKENTQVQVEKPVPIPLCPPKNLVYGEPLAE
jgi:hypothetical protein